MSQVQAPPSGVSLATLGADWAIQTEAALFDNSGRPLNLIVCCTSTLAGPTSEGRLENINRVWREVIGANKIITPTALRRPAISTSNAIAQATGLRFARTSGGFPTVHYFDPDLSLSFPVTSISELAGEFAYATGVNSFSGRTLTRVVEDLPIPIFGSPPKDWAPLKALGAAGSYAAALATLIGTGHPVIAGITVVSSFVIYVAKPTADVLRQNLADRVERRLRLPDESATRPALPAKVQELPPSTFY